MIEFISQNIYFKFKNNGLRDLTRDFKFRFSIKKKSFFCVAPKGMETDLASVPKIFWSLFPKDDPEYLKSAVAHDYFYKLGGLIKVQDEESGKSTHIQITRYQADCLFKQGAKALGSSWWECQVLFLSVRGFGGASWGKEKQLKNMKMNPHKNPDPRIRG